jgi:hypothetical protein
MQDPPCLHPHNEQLLGEEPHPLRSSSNAGCDVDQLLLTAASHGPHLPRPPHLSKDAAQGVTKALPSSNTRSSSSSLPGCFLAVRKDISYRGNHPAPRTAALCRSTPKTDVLVAFQVQHRQAVNDCKVVPSIASMLAHSAHALCAGPITRKCRLLKCCLEGGLQKAAYTYGIEWCGHWPIAGTHMGGTIPSQR